MKLKGRGNSCRGSPKKDGNKKYFADKILSVENKIGG